VTRKPVPDPTKKQFRKGSNGCKEEGQPEESEKQSQQRQEGSSGHRRRKSSPYAEECQGVFLSVCQQSQSSQGTLSREGAETPAW